MSEVETLYAILASVDFSFALTLLSGLYHPPGTRGHPYSNPLTLLKIELVKRFVQVESYAQVHRRLQSSEEWRRVCGIGSLDTVPHTSTWSRFRKRVGAATLQLILGDLLRQLDSIGIHKVSTIAADATFIEAYSKRDPKNNTVGYSDPEARLRKEGRNVTLGYGFHLAVDARSKMPLAVIVEPANVNEKKLSTNLLHKALRRKHKTKSVVADSQYSSEAFRVEAQRYGVEPVIPYPKNQMKGKRVLRLDRRFRSHGPWRLKRLYRTRSSVERTVSRLKTYFWLCQIRTRGLRNVLSHVLLCLIARLMTALSSIIHAYPNKMRSPTFSCHTHA